MYDEWLEHQNTGSDDVQELATEVFVNTAGECYCQFGGFKGLQVEFLQGTN